MAKKPLLFYSLYCEHSKAVLSYIARKGIKDIFLLVNVDRHHNKVPSFINSVPCVFNGQAVLKDDDLNSYIDAEAEKHGSQVEIDAYYQPEMGSSMSDSYAYLETDPGVRVERSFTSLDSDFKIETPKEDDYGKGMKASEIDKYKMDREKELSQILGGQQQQQRLVR
jgi:hypothetical protein